MLSDYTIFPEDDFNAGAFATSPDDNVAVTSPENLFGLDIISSISRDDTNPGAGEDGAASAEPQYFGVKRQSELDDEDDLEIEEDREGGETSSITQFVKTKSEKYLLPSELVQMEELPEKFCLAGYVLESVGTVGTSGLIQSAGKPSPSKKRKTEKSLWHALYIADEKMVIKIWGRYNISSSTPKTNSVRRLSELPQKQVVAMFMYDGPFELSMCNPRFKKYDLCNNDIEIKLLKAKVLPFDSGTLEIPEYQVTTSHGYEAASWSNIDTIIDSSTSFEVNCTMAIVGLNGRHSNIVSRGGKRYLKGFMQDCHGAVREFTVWSHIDSFLHIIPKNVATELVIIKFVRVRVKPLTTSAYGNQTRCASIATNTSFSLASRTLEEVTRSGVAAQGSVSSTDIDALDGFS